MKYLIVICLLLASSAYAVDCQEELDNYLAKNADYEKALDAAVNIISSDASLYTVMMQKAKKAHMDRWESLYELNVCYYETSKWRIEGKWPDQEMIGKVIYEADKTPW